MTKKTQGDLLPVEVTPEDVAEAEKFRRGKGSVYDREVSRLAYSFASARAAQDGIDRLASQSQQAVGEREQIVAWLRSDQVQWHHPLTDEAILALADAIDRGDFLRTPGEAR